MAWVVFVAGGLLLALYATLFDVWTIPTDDPVLSASIEPTFSAGDLIVLSRHGSPGRSELLRCPDPQAPGRYVIARAIARSGERIALDDEVASVDGRRTAKPARVRGADADHARPEHERRRGALLLDRGLRRRSSSRVLRANAHPAPPTQATVTSRPLVSRQRRSPPAPRLARLRTARHPQPASTSSSASSAPPASVTPSHGSASSGEGRPAVFLVVSRRSHGHSARRRLRSLRPLQRPRLGDLRVRASPGARASPRPRRRPGAPAPRAAAPRAAGARCSSRTCSKPRRAVPRRPQAPLRALAASPRAGRPVEPRRRRLLRVHARALRAACARSRIGGILRRRGGRRGSRPVGARQASPSLLWRS